MPSPILDPRRSSLFISHGAPSLLQDGGPAADFLRELGRGIVAPKAVVCMSAHWETRAPAFTSSAAPETIHDFSGFPESMYRLRYPAPGDPELAGRAAALCAASGVAATLDPARGYDHGAWVPLMALFPEAKVPVIQVSIPFAEGPRGAYALGRALRPLMAEGVLLLASGGFTHNLRELSRAGGPAEWAKAFHAWAVAALREGRLEDLLDAPASAPHFREAHPRMEHWLPLYFALGSVELPWSCEALHEGFEFGSLSMDAFAFSSERPA